MKVKKDKVEDDRIYVSTAISPSSTELCQAPSSSATFRQALLSSVQLHRAPLSPQVLCQTFMCSVVLCWAPFIYIERHRGFPIPPSIVVTRDLLLWSILNSSELLRAFLSSDEQQRASLRSITPFQDRKIFSFPCREPQSSIEHRWALASFVKIYWSL